MMAIAIVQFVAATFLKILACMTITTGFTSFITAADNIIALDSSNLLPCLAFLHSSIETSISLKSGIVS